MRTTRSQGLVAIIVIAMLLSVGITGYRTLVLQDYEIIDEPLEEEELVPEDEALPAEDGSEPVLEGEPEAPLEEELINS